MGYCGFGIQRWIYNFKPRKPFRRRDFLGGYDIIYFDRFQFKLKDTILHTSESIVKRNCNKKKTEKISKIYSILADYFIISFCLFIIYLFISIYRNFDSEGYAKQLNSIYLKQQNDKNKSFHLCLKYGEYYLLNEEYENALREFAQATRLYPESKRVNTLRIITRMLMNEPCNRNFEIQNFEEIKLSNDFYLSSELIDLINRKMMAKN